MRTHRLLRQEQQGLTMVELIAVIVISGIMATGVVTYILRSVEGISNTATRNQLASSARIVLDRMSMELHNSLPNSIRSATSGGRECIEFIPVRSATTYIDPPFTGGGGAVFDVVDFTPSQHGVSGGYAVIYPDNQSQVYDGDNTAPYNVPDFPTPGPIQEIDDIVDSVSADQSTVTLIAAHRFNRRSPNQRFFVAEQPVSFCLEGARIYRYTNYGFYTSQVTAEEESGVCEIANNQRCLPNYSSAPDKMLIVNNIANAGAAFTVGTQSLTRNALVSIDLTLSLNGDSVSLSHEVLTRSVP